MALSLKAALVVVGLVHSESLENTSGLFSKTPFILGLHTHAIRIPFPREVQSQPLPQALRKACGRGYSKAVDSMHSANYRHRNISVYLAPLDYANSGSVIKWRS